MGMLINVFGIECKFISLSFNLKFKMKRQDIVEIIGEEKSAYLLDHQSKTISKDLLHLPGSDFVDRIWMQSNRNPQVLRSLQAIYGHGRLAESGYVSILPVDQGIEHSCWCFFCSKSYVF
jgi:class I fructose-bisphosphate aldolase